MTWPSAIAVGVAAIRASEPVHSRCLPARCDDGARAFFDVDGQGRAFDGGWFGGEGDGEFEAFFADREAASFSASVVFGEEFGDFFVKLCFRFWASGTVAVFARKPFFERPAGEAVERGAFAGDGYQRNVPFRYFAFAGAGTVDHGFGFCELIDALDGAAADDRDLDVFGRCLRDRDQDEGRDGGGEDGEAETAPARSLAGSLCFESHCVSPLCSNARRVLPGRPC